MSEREKVKRPPLEELADLRRRVAEQEAEIARRRQAEADQRRINHNLPVLVATAGFDGYYKEVNPAFERVLGWSERESLARPFLEFIHPNDRETAVEVFSRLQSGQTVTDFVDRNVCKDGSYRWINWVVIPLPSRGIVFGVGQDITERRVAEEALQQVHQELERQVEERTAELREANERLQESHDELQAIYDGMTDGLLIADAETKRFLQANASICRMLGYSKEEVLARWVTDLHPAEDMPAVLEAFRALAEGRLSVAVEVPVMRKDGSTFVADIGSHTAVYRGRPCLIGFFHDVTERTQAQDTLERERQSLLRMLQASDHERQIISYDIHDGLAQYLAAAGMHLQVYESMREHAPDEAEKAYKTAVELVRRAHAESRRLVSEVRHPVIDEKGLESAILNLVYEQQRRGGPKIECHTSVEFDRLPPILENALYRMVQEALTNACKHSKSEKVTVAMIQTGRDIQLEVRDWGLGCDAVGIGEGHFGLESIRQRARLLGGRLAIESAPGSGTLVQVVVPIPDKEIEDD